MPLLMSDPPPAPVSRSSAKGTDPLIGRVIDGRYRVISLLARGGMGRVYRAEQAPLGRLVALKVLNTTHYGETGDLEFQKRFFLEASIHSKLTHPNTVTIHDYGKTEDDVFYITMELLEGRTLAAALREAGPFPPQRASHIARQICRALREAHAHGVIHRDLKPANVFLVQHGDQSDFVKVLDFGLVKNIEDPEQLTQRGLFMGSPKYMSPEQIRSDTVDARADIYALGVILCEMLTGKVPFDDPSSVNILMAHVQTQVPPLHTLNPSVEVPQELEQIVRKCLAKHPRDRYATMEELLRALKAADGEGPSLIDEQHAALSSLREPHAPMYSTPPLSSPPSEPLTQSLTPFAHAARPSGSSAPLFLAALFALTGIAGFVALSGRFGPVRELPVESAQESAAPERAEENEGTDDDSARTVLVSLRSTPPGATVQVGDQEYGPTPTQIEWSGRDAAYGRVVKFRFRHEGYLDLTITRQIRGDHLDVHPPPMQALPGTSEPPR